MKHVTAILALAFAPAIICLPAPSHADTTAIKQFINEHYADELPKNAGKMSLRQLRRHFDSYTQIMSQEEIDERELAFAGVVKNSFGVNLGVGNNGARVLSIMPNGPAYFAGVREEDVIERMDGDYRGLLDAMVGAGPLTRPTGTVVNLQIRRDGKVFTQQIKFNTFELDPVTYAVSGRVLSIRINRFSQGLAQRFKTITAWIDPKTIDTLILDVRGNPGGLRDEAVELAEQFIPLGDTICAFKFRRETTYSISKRVSRWRDPRPIFILQDGESASGSELFAGALLVRCHAVLIGSTTYGKGRMQRIITEKDVPNIAGDDVAGLYMTIAFFLPGGTLDIDESGIPPSIEFVAPHREVGELPHDFDVAKWRRRIQMPEQRHIDSANALGYGNIAPIIWGERLAPYHAINDVRLALLEQRKSTK